MTSTTHHIAQARIALLTLGEVSHAALLSSHAVALDELRAAAQETEKLARVHPATMLKEAAAAGFGALSLLSVFVFGRSFATAYLQLQAQVKNIEIPFIDLSSQTSKLFPEMPWLEQVARLPEMTWEQAMGASLIVAATILLCHVVKAFLLLRRERTLAHSARALHEAAAVVRAAAAAGSREQAFSLLAEGMENHRK